MPSLTNVDVLSFLSRYPVDKVVQTGNIQITNSGATTNNPFQSYIQTGSVTNEYGRKAFCRFFWSVDNVNFNSSDSILVYAWQLSVPAVPITVDFGGLKGAVSAGVSSSTITFRTANGLHGNATQVGATYTYTPTSQTFYIKYALISVL